MNKVKYVKPLFLIYGKPKIQCWWNFEEKKKLNFKRPYSDIVIDSSVKGKCFPTTRNLVPWQVPAALVKVPKAGSDWPGNSSDLNLTEKLCCVVKRKMTLQTQQSKQPLRLSRLIVSLPHHIVVADHAKRGPTSNNLLPGVRQNNNDPN